VNVSHNSTSTLPFNLCSETNGPTRFVYYMCGGSAGQTVMFNIRNSTNAVVYHTSRPSLADTCNFLADDEVTGYFDVKGLAGVSGSVTASLSFSFSDQ
jgi:hypothetical protein